MHNKLSHYLSIIPIGRFFSMENATIHINNVTISVAGITYHIEPPPHTAGKINAKSVHNIRPLSIPIRNDLSPRSTDWY